MSATVNRYLTALRTSKPRGRPISAATLEQRLVGARSRFQTSLGVEKLLAAQEIRDIQTRLTRFESAASVDVKGLEAEFVKIAQQFGENRGVTYGTWRDAGVPAEVLQRAGIKRTRG
jgi:hypothetical protein